MKKFLPLFYFRPTICWVDDDKLFLDAVSSSFEEDYHCILFNDPSLANIFFQDYQSATSQMNFTKECVSDLSNTVVDINIPALSALASQKHLHEIAILVVDFNMPQMTGIELCKQLRDVPCKKILLTGETDYNLAIDGFNQGLIDKFVAKGPDIADILKEYINELSYQYFYDQTQHLLSHFDNPSASPLTDKMFIEFFYQWCEQNNAREFYLIDRQGSFLIKKANNTFVFFLVMSEYDKQAFLNLHDDAHEKVGNLLQALSNGQAIPFFGIGKESWEFDFEDWNTHFHQAEILEGKTNYYWTTIEAKLEDIQLYNLGGSL